MLSYAQNREDVLLARCFPGPTGFYVDIGAADPIGHSVTKWFSEQGWTGINVEPSVSFFRKIEADRPRDINLNVGVAETPGEMTFYEVENLVGCSTLVPEVAEEYRRSGHTITEWPVQIQTLSQIFAAHAPSDRPVDFLKIDVEGLEPAVLAGMDFHRWRPKVLVIEATHPSSPEPSHEQWEHLVLPFDYRFAYFDGLNRYYVRNEDESLLLHFAKPVCPFDDFVLYEQLHWEKEARFYLARTAERDQELQAKEVELLKRCRDYDDIYYRWTLAQNESDYLSRQIEPLNREIDRRKREIAQIQRELAAHKNALAAAKVILAETRAHIDQIRVASFIR